MSRRRRGGVEPLTPLNETIEPHPRWHDWDTLDPRDYVQSWTSRVINGVRTRIPTHIKRVERCPNCPLERVSQLVVATWEPYKSTYIRGRRKGTTLVRVSRAEWTRRRFLERSDLGPEVLDTLR